MSELDRKMVNDKKMREMTKNSEDPLEAFMKQVKAGKTLDSMTRIVPQIINHIYLSIIYRHYTVCLPSKDRKCTEKKQPSKKKFLNSTNWHN